jgi:hypothetical protein
MNAEQKTMGSGNAGRNKGDFIAGVQDVIEPVSAVIAEDTFDSVKGKIEVLCNLQGRAPFPGKMDFGSRRQSTLPSQSVQIAEQADSGIG